jgi:hypothetical protein
MPCFAHRASEMLAALRKCSPRFGNSLKSPYCSLIRLISSRIRFASLELLSNPPDALDSFWNPLDSVEFLSNNARRASEMLAALCSP